MIKKPETKASAIRLTLDYWEKLRRLMRVHHGRKWLERCIDREINKLDKKEKGE